MEKTKKQKIIIIVVTISILIVILGLYLGLPTEKRYNDMIFGDLTIDTYINVNVVNQKKIGKKIYDSVVNIDNLINPTTKTSDIYKINNSKIDEKIQVDPLTIELLKISFDVYKKTNGLFNPASYTLVDLWGFSAEKFNPTIEHVEPTQDKIDLGIKLAEKFDDIKFINAFDTPEQILEKTQNATFLVNEVENYVIRTNKCFINEEGSKIDLGGIAKGYAAESCYNVFKDSIAKDGLVNIAGNVYTFNKDWKVGIENPFKGQKLENGEDETGIFGVATVNNLGVSCSGVYLRNYKINDKLYHHIINPFTGRPQELNKDSIVMAGVIGKDGAIGDAVATALVLLGSIDKATEFINNNYKDEIESVILITGNKDYKIIGNTSIDINSTELVGFNEYKG